MFWMAAAAWADQMATSDVTCEIADLVGTFPADGDDGVSPDAVITLVFSTPGCGGPFFSGELGGLAGVVPTTVEQPEPHVLQVIPDEPLELGATYHLTGDTDSGPLSVTFRVGAGGLGYAAEPIAVTVDPRSRCDGIPFTQVQVTTTFDALGSGLLQASVSSNGQGGEFTTVASLEGRSEVSFDLDVMNVGREYCVTQRLVDEVGEVVWETTPTCATGEDRTCPDPDTHDGSSCATAPGGAGLAALALGLLAQRRRR